MMSLLIKDCRILEGSKLIKKNILIEKGKIAMIASRKQKADKVYNAKGNIVLPGLIDCHVHMREPGLTHKENFYTGSMACAAGGITTFLDMPNTMPPTINAIALDTKRRLAEKSVVNYGFHFGSNGKNIGEIKSVSNIASVKVYMDKTTGDLEIKNNDLLKEIFNSYKTISVHAEGNNVKKAIGVIQNTNNSLYVCHVLGKKGIDMIKKYKGKESKVKNKIENRIYAEVTPHHLFLNKNDEKRLKGFGMVKPPLGTKQDQNALWEALKKGLIDTIATDHAPHTRKEKGRARVPYGVPGVETMLPLLLDAVNKRKLKLSQVVKLTANNPAAIFSIKNKGFIKIGYDADLVVVDMKKVKKVTNRDLFTKCKWSPFEGWKLKGWPVATFVNGNLIYENDQIYNIKAKEVEFS